jgi:predicted RNase H-like HicB family nuclease
LTGLALVYYVQIIRISGGQMDKKLKVTIELWQKEKWVIARIPELDFIAQGQTIEEAKKNLNEVVKIQLAEMKEMGTFEDYLAECGSNSF